MRKKRKPNKYQTLIGKFCKDPTQIWANKGKVKAEMSVAKKLYELQPSESFWKKAYVPFKINSLRWFLTESGKAYLSLELKRHSLDLGSNVSYDLLNHKIGEDKKVTPKIKSVKDFINAKN